MDEKVRTLIRNGVLPKAKDCLCWICGTGRWENPKVRMEYHHPDLSKRTEVIPLCKKCHVMIHTVQGDMLQNQSEIAKKRWEDPAQKEAQAQRNSERVISEETRQKMSQSAYNRHQSK